MTYTYINFRIRINEISNRETRTYLRRECLNLRPEWLFLFPLAIKQFLELFFTMATIIPIFADQDVQTERERKKDVTSTC